MPLSNRSAVRASGSTPGRRRLISFAIAGTLGFMVDAGVLTGLLHLGSDRRLARLASFACALVATWLINRSTTFADRAGALSLAEFIRYAGASSGAAVVNLGVYLALTSGCDVFRREPVIAIAAATGLSMSLNFWSYLRLVFAR